MSEYIPPFARDIRFLFLKYLELNTTSLQSFKQLWKNLKFSHIHEGRSEEVNYENYIQEVYCTCLGYLMFSPTISDELMEHRKEQLEEEELTEEEINKLFEFQIRISVIYTLYYLYTTQPKDEKKVQIKISIELFYEILKLREEFKNKDLIEPYIIINKLKEMNAFEYCALIYIDPLMSSLTIPKNLSDETNIDEELIEEAIKSNIDIDFNEIDRIEHLYCENKEKLISILKQEDNNSLERGLSLVKPTLVEEMKELIEKKNNEEKISQFLDKYENDPNGSLLIKKRRRKKRGKKKVEERTKRIHTTKKPPSKVSLEVSKSVNEFITSNALQNFNEEEKKEEEKKKKRKKNDKEETTSTTKKKKKKTSKESKEGEESNKSTTSKKKKTSSKEGEDQQESKSTKKKKKKKENTEEESVKKKKKKTTEKSSKKKKNSQPSSSIDETTVIVEAPRMAEIDTITTNNETHLLPIITADSTIEK
ncbi:hypothetical protein ABK040_007126 [Willaertia magna]